MYKKFWSQWWFSVDSKSIIALLGLMFVGIVLITTASPAVAERIKVSHFYFVYKQLEYIALGIPLLFFVSLINSKYIPRVGALGFTITIVLMMLVLFIGDETKGAKRWLTVLGFSLQPSEILKPFYTILTANILVQENLPSRFIVCGLLHAIVVGLLLLQPDFGMAVTVSVALCTQFFLAGLRRRWIICIACILCILGITAYMMLPHVAKRLDLFFHPEIGNAYQIHKSLESYIKGGLWGCGPGEGTVKYILPDSHADFIFAVAAEEFGTIFCLSIVLLISFIVICGILNITKMQDMHKVYMAGGMLSYFAFQSIFNIGVTVHLFPTKGMTLPFVSYGGSSMLSFALAMGIYFNVTRREFFRDHICKTQHNWIHYPSIS